MMLLLSFSLIASCSETLSWLESWKPIDPVVDTQDKKSAAALGKIKHIVVLMLENRSFDNLLGQLYPKSDQFNGLSGEESNLFTSAGMVREIKVWNEADVNIAKTIPSPDPGESFSDMNEQLFDMSVAPAGGAATMSGFAQNYFQYSSPASPDAIMHYYLPEQVPVLSQLAKNYAVCDAWFASAPCQTWPNRFFLHTGTAGGYENNSPYHFPYEMPTIFTRFNQLNRDNGWKIYYHDFPQALALSDLWFHLDQMRHYSQFKEDAANGSLPSYSFIEPQYYAEIDFPSDQHPPHDIRFGEELIADVYNTLQASPAWTNTLLIITYDEHGGCYDHVPPPQAIPPEAPRADQLFHFDRYGVRVPAVVISPYIPAGTVFRAPVNSQPFDHTSVISTVRRCFDLGEPLTDRDRNAPDLSSILTLADDQLNLGAPLVVPAVDRSPELLEKIKADVITDLQKGMREIAAHLPDPRSDDELQPVPESDSQDEAISYIKDKLNAVLPQTIPKN